MIDDHTIARLSRLRHWKISGGTATRGQLKVSFRARTWSGRQFASVNARLRADETISELIVRSVNELERRLQDGMPKPSPAIAERRKLRAAVSPSRHVN